MKEFEERTVRILLKTTEPKLEGDIWKIIAIATVLKDKTPIPDIDVQFYVEGEARDTLTATEGDGRAKKTLQVKEGHNLIEARIEDERYPGHYTASTTIFVAPKEQRKAAKIISHESGHQGNYIITFQVLTEDDKPVSGAVLRVVGLRKVLDLPPTDRKGTTQGRLRVLETEKEKIFTVLVLGSSVETWINLFY